MPRRQVVVNFADDLVAPDAEDPIDGVGDRTKSANDHDIVRRHQFDGGDVARHLEEVDQEIQHGHGQAHEECPLPQRLEARPPYEPLQANRFAEQAPADRERHGDKDCYREALDIPAIHGRLREG